MMASHWEDEPSVRCPVRAEFADGSVSWTTVEHAADLLDFVDRQKGIEDLTSGSRLRTHLGTVMIFETRWLS